jgi:hypothetical protein
MGVFDDVADVFTFGGHSARKNQNKVAGKQSKVIDEQLERERIANERRDAYFSQFLDPTLKALFSGAGAGSGAGVDPYTQIEQLFAGQSSPYANLEARTRAYTDESGSAYDSAVQDVLMDYEARGLTGDSTGIRGDIAGIRTAEAENMAGTRRDLRVRADDENYARAFDAYNRRKGGIDEGYRRVLNLFPLTDAALGREGTNAQIAVWAAFKDSGRQERRRRISRWRRRRAFCCRRRGFPVQEAQTPGRTRWGLIPARPRPPIP